jgi:hypothetical protein
MFRSFPMGFPSTALPRATPGDNLAIYFHCCEGPRGDVQIQDLFVELILHRVEEDTWENIIESLLQGLDVTEVNGLVQKIEPGNHRFLKIMGLSCHFSLKPIRSRGKHLQFDDDDAHLFYESYKYIYNSWTNGRNK